MDIFQYFIDKEMEVLKIYVVFPKHIANIGRAKMPTQAVFCFCSLLYFGTYSIYQLYELSGKLI
jgi:hypothetical protein